MFTMMNHARLNVGVQGISLSDRAYQLARSHAQERIQGTVPGKKGRVSIINHPDVRRMLLLMKSQVEAMRAAAYLAGGLIDRVLHAPDEALRKNAEARLDLLVPVVKGWLTETAQEVTSLGIQVHGGMGFVEETGAAQFMRDARILPIYEGTTGIQGNDFIGRKVLGDEGRALRELLGDMRETISALRRNDSLADLASPLDEAVGLVEYAVDWLVAAAPGDPHAPGTASVNLLMLLGTVLGGWLMARAALAVSAEGAGFDASFAEAKRQTAAFYCSHVLPRATAYQRAATASPGQVMSMADASF
jgi:hypothetical protein